jgi:hypothetical protein
MGVFVVLWIPAFFDPTLAWMWIGFAGLLGLATGLAEVIAPTWFLASRRRFLNDAPAWQRRVAEALDPPNREVRISTVRIIGVVVATFGFACLAGAAVILLAL